MNLQVHPDATADVKSIAYRMGESDKKLGHRFADAVRSAYARIAENPRLGQFSKTLKNGAEVRRSIPWPFRNHQVIYLVLPNEVVIPRVVHSASNFQALLDSGFLEGLSEGIQ
jgi:plasmid stabilization system protein ParE